MKTSKKLLIAFIILCTSIVTCIGLLSSCEELILCDGSCSDSNPWSNDHTSYCYHSKAECEYDTGYTCTTCN